MAGVSLSSFFLLMLLHFIGVVSMHLFFSKLLDLELLELPLSHLSIFKLSLLTVRVTKRVIVQHWELLVLWFHLVCTVVVMILHLIICTWHESLAVVTGPLAHMARRPWPIDVFEVQITLHSSFIFSNSLLVIDWVVEVFNFHSGDFICIASMVWKVRLDYFHFLFLLYIRWFLVNLVGEVLELLRDFPVNLIIRLFILDTLFLRFGSVIVI